MPARNLTLLAPDLGDVWIPGSRWRLALLTLASLGMAAASAAVPLLTTNGWYHVVGWFGLFFFGLGAIVLAWRTVQPGGVQLTRDGFTAKTFRGGFSRRWSDVEDFQVVKIGQSAEYVGYMLKPGARRHPFGDVARQVPGVDGMLPGQLVVKPEDLVPVLEEWRSRYGAGAAERS